VSTTTVTPTLSAPNAASLANSGSAANAESAAPSTSAANSEFGERSRSGASATSGESSGSGESCRSAASSMSGAGSRSGVDAAPVSASPGVSSTALGAASTPVCAGSTAPSARSTPLGAASTDRLQQQLDAELALSGLECMVRGLWRSVNPEPAPQLQPQRPRTIPRRSRRSAWIDAARYPDLLGPPTGQIRTP
jgi:hypothetical protein